MHNDIILSIPITLGRGWDARAYWARRRLGQPFHKAGGGVDERDGGCVRPGHGANLDRHGARAPREDDDWEGVVKSKSFLVLFFKKELLFWWGKRRMTQGLIRPTGGGVEAAQGWRGSLPRSLLRWIEGAVDVK